MRIFYKYIFLSYIIFCDNLYIPDKNLIKNIFSNILLHAINLKCENNCSPNTTCYIYSNIWF